MLKEKHVLSKTNEVKHYLSSIQPIGSPLQLGQFENRFACIKL